MNSENKTNSTEESKILDPKEEIAEISEDLPEEIAEILEDLPKPEREKIIKRLMVSEESRLEYSGKGQMPILLPLMNKMNEEHIHKVLDNQKIETEGKIELTKLGMNNKIIFAIIGVGVFGIIIFAYWLLSDNLTIINSLNTLLSHLGALLAGVLGGFGYSHFKK